MTQATADLTSSQTWTHLSKMPFIVQVLEPGLFHDDDSPFHEILARHGILRGDYQVLRPTIPLLQFEELNDDVIGELEDLGPVKVERVD
ncbi:hypothetical protein BDV39DRAFT_175255 [Aspergillus sergii]|uniref:Uncharacterized protein n=1 Tax=Aspergillus sergii TaxID=1034303 RepID=A0A5N6X2U2_9EURO|nr:hypothetical protein BDV39DRAFT_175255 [Aspergillus sergii]